MDACYILMFLLLLSTKSVSKLIMQFNTVLIDMIIACVLAKQSLFRTLISWEVLRVHRINRTLTRLRLTLAVHVSRISEHKPNKLIMQLMNTADMLSRLSTRKTVPRVPSLAL